MKLFLSFRRFSAAVVLAIGMFGGSAYGVPITIINGGFESSPGGPLPPEAPQYVTISGVGADLNGWTVMQGSVDVIFGYWPSHTGNRSLDLNGLSVGGIMQDIQVDIDGDVTVDFAMAGNPDDPEKLKSLKVSLISSEGISFTFDATSTSREDMGWITQQAIFTGMTAGMYTLQFESTTLLGNPFYGAALDSVSASVNAANVPDGGTTAALLGASLAGIAFLRRKLGLI